MLKRISKVFLGLTAIALFTPLMVRGASAQKAPEFTLPTAQGTQYSSTAHKGHRVVISFYKGYY
jgi:hypothetical protein